MTELTPKFYALVGAADTETLHSGFYEIPADNAEVDIECTRTGQVCIGAFSADHTLLATFEPMAVAAHEKVRAGAFVVAVSG